MNTDSGRIATGGAVATGARAGGSAGAGRRGVRAILLGGLIGGALDLSYAFIVSALRGYTPVRVSQSVAAGLLGRDAAFSGGIPVALLGVALHFSMALVMAAVYYFAATKIPLLVRRATVCGLIYGLGLYCVMNYIVIPLSAIGPRPLPPLYMILPEVAVHMVFVGLTIATFTRRALRA